MKKIKYLFLTILTVATIASCIDDNNDELSEGATTGGLLSVDNPLISYVVGSGNTYTATGSAFQGRIQTNKVDVYKELSYQVFLTDVTGMDSIVTRKTNKKLFKTINISDASIGLSNSFSISFDYADLIDGLLKPDGTSLPTNDGDLSIGDFWELTYEATTSENDTNVQSVSTKVAVGTRYAGVYVAQDTQYFRLSVAGASWDDQEVIIESVNATIYKHVGIAHWTDGNNFYFTVDNTTGVITIMDVDLDGNGVLLNSEPIMTCAVNNAFAVLNCDNSTSLAVPDDVNGKDVLNLTFGYLTAGSGPREFFEKLVKKVD